MSYRGSSSRQSGQYQGNYHRRHEDAYNVRRGEARSYESPGPMRAAALLPPRPVEAYHETSRNYGGSSSRGGRNGMAGSSYGNGGGAINPNFAPHARRGDHASASPARTFSPHASLPPRPTILRETPPPPGETPRGRSLRILRKFRERLHKPSSPPIWTEEIAGAYVDVMDGFEHMTGSERTDAAQSIAQCCGPHVSDDMSDRAANSIFDLCEDDDVELRKTGYRALGDLSNADPARLTKRIVDALVTLLQYENEDEYAVVTETLLGQIHAHPLDALSVIVLDHCLSSFRPICLQFLSTQAGDVLRQGVHGNSELEAAFGQALAQVVPHADDGQQLGFIATLIGPLDTLWMTRADFEHDEQWRACSSAAQTLLDTYAIRLLQSMHDAPDDELLALQSVADKPTLDPSSSMNLAGVVLENLSGQCYSYASSGELLSTADFGRFFFEPTFDQHDPKREEGPPIALLSRPLRLAIARIAAKAAYNILPRLGLHPDSQSMSKEQMLIVEEASTLATQISSAIKIIFPPDAQGGISIDSLELAEALIYAHSAAMKAWKSQSNSKKLVSLSEDPSAIKSARALCEASQRLLRQSAKGTKAGNIAESVYGLTRELQKTANLSRPLDYRPVPDWMEAPSAHFIGRLEAQAVSGTASKKRAAPSEDEDEEMKNADDVIIVDGPVASSNDRAARPNDERGEKRQRIAGSAGAAPASAFQVPTEFTIRRAAPAQEDGTLQPVAMRDALTRKTDGATAAAMKTADLLRASSVRQAQTAAPRSVVPRFEGPGGTRAGFADGRYNREREHPRQSSRPSVNGGTPRGPATETRFAGPRSQYAVRGKYAGRDLFDNTTPSETNGSRHPPPRPVIDSQYSKSLENRLSKPPGSQSSSLPLMARLGGRQQSGTGK